MQYESLILNGTWKIEPGSARPARYTHRIAVPSLVDMGRPEFNWVDFEYFWYRTEFNLTRIAAVTKVFLQLEQVQFGTRIVVNGEEAGGDIPCYTSQEFDLTSLIKTDAVNILEIRVGRKESLPSHSAVGNDYEKRSYIPGIWGDVHLHIYQAARIKDVRIIPDINSESIVLDIDCEFFLSDLPDCQLECRVVEKENRCVVANHRFYVEDSLPLHSVIKIPEMQMWSPEKPFLYELVLKLSCASIPIAHERCLTFGMREFCIRNGHFHLNGQRRVLLGSNIAFHRLLSDEDRGTLPWQEDWIKKVLVDIPKEHNMSCFRIHNGHAYNRWYDIADQHGILLQDEWMFWPPTGSAEQIETEFRAWIKEHHHHPSIVIWDPLNESEDERVTGQIIPRIKQLDPTRPWEQVDFKDDHPYIYSLGPVLNNEKFGFSRSIPDLERSREPKVINEYVWWWLDKHGNPSELTEWVIERWLGRKYRRRDLLEHQAFLASELTELWRRINADAIMPFVYLSCNQGATAHWFRGSLADLKPKPVMARLKMALAPVGVSINLWDRHFLASRTYTIEIYVFNDSPETSEAMLCLQLQDRKLVFDILSKQITLISGEHRIETIDITIPETEGQARLIAGLRRGRNVFARSIKPVHIFSGDIGIKDQLRNLKIGVPEIDQEYRDFFLKHQAILRPMDTPGDADVVFMDSMGIRQSNKKNRQVLSGFVKDGGILIVQEPEYGVTGSLEITVLDGLSLWIQFRKDPERGGYDSYVFIEDIDNPLWHGIDPEYLKMWNGGWGGEIVSAHHVRPAMPFHTLAACNIKLRVPAVMKIPYGHGTVYISRLQVRGRLKEDGMDTRGYQRKSDPVAQKYFANLLGICRSDIHKSLQRQLEDDFYITRVMTSTGQVYDIDHHCLYARWPDKRKGEITIRIFFLKTVCLQDLVVRGLKCIPEKVAVAGCDPAGKWATVKTESAIEMPEMKIKFGPAAVSALRLTYQSRSAEKDATFWEIQIG